MSFVKFIQPLSYSKTVIVFPIDGVNRHNLLYNPINSNITTLVYLLRSSITVTGLPTGRENQSSLKHSYQRIHSNQNKAITAAVNLNLAYRFISSQLVMPLRGSREKAGGIIHSSVFLLMCLCPGEYERTPKKTSIKKLFKLSIIHELKGALFIGYVLLIS